MMATGETTLAANRQRLTLNLDGQSIELPALWLRERAPDADTLDPLTGQRLIEAAALPLDLAIDAQQWDQQTLSLQFNDGCHARFTAAELRSLLLTTRAGTQRKLWDATLTALPETDFQAALSDDETLLEMLEQLHRMGFTLVSGVPTENDGMQPLINRIGPLRHTNWGGIADVKSVANAYDLTMTQRGLEPHSDNPYRDPIPGYIWLHCLTNASESGDSTLVDGYMAAQCLQTHNPEAYHCLTRVWPTFRYQDSNTYLQSEGPLIELDSQGDPIRIRYSNRTERVPALPADELDAYYAARQAFYQLITGEELTLNLKLKPGQMLIMDNYRLLHGRKAFELAGGTRHLRQGYVDRDSTFSRRMVLRQQLTQQESPQ